MAIGQDFSLPFSGYDPHPEIPGAYQFHPVNGGNPILAAGPEAERMRTMIDQQAPPPDMRTANNSIANLPPGAGLGADPSIRQNIVDMSRSDAGGAGASISHASPAAPVTPATAIPASMSAPTSAGALPAGPAVVDSRAPATAAPGAGQTGLPDISNDVKIVHTKAGWTPGSQSIAAKGGIQDPAMREEMLKAYGTYAEAEDKAALDQKLALQNQLTENATMYEAEKNKSLLLEKQRADAAAKEERKAALFADVMAKKQDELAKMSAREVKPNRVFEGRPGAQILAAISAGLGAMGSAIAHVPNFASDYINRQIDHDIEAQRDEINRGVAAKQNDIARIKDQYSVGTNAAEKIAALQATDYASALARKQAAMIGGQQAQMALAGIDKELAASRMKRLAELQVALNGEVETKSDAKYHAGGDSVVVNPLLTGAAKATGLRADIAKNVSTEQHGGAAPGRQSGEGKGKLGQRLASTEAINEAGGHDIANLQATDPGGYLVPMPSFMKSKERLEYEAAVTAAAPKILAANGENQTQENLEHVRNGLLHADPNVRDAAQRQYSKAGKIVHQAIERQRGGVVGAASGTADSAENE